MRNAIAAIIGLAIWTQGPVMAQTQLPNTTILEPEATLAPPPDPNRVILPGVPEGPEPAAGPPATLPPAWLVPLPNEAERAADRARLDRALEARFARPAEPVQRFAADIVPPAGGQPWQMLQRRIDDTLGP
jgi:hypothetical protein